jgi:hypothetical protein
MPDTPCPDCHSTGTFAGMRVHTYGCPTRTPGPLDHLVLGPEFGQDLTSHFRRYLLDDADSGPQLSAHTIQPATKTVEGPLFEGTLTFQKLAEAIRALPPLPPQHPDTVRRDRYASIILNAIKSRSAPSSIPGQLPTLGATEHEVADAVLAAVDTDTAQLLAERNAALNLCDVWDDAPDPACRAMAADLRSAIRGARAARLLDCGWCYEENGQEVHPHPECPIGRTTPDTGVTIPAALTAPTPEEQARQLAALKATVPCGDTCTGGFGNTLGPCIKDAGHGDEFHRDARGAEWRYYRDTPHRAELARRLASAIHRYDYEHGLTGNDVPGSHYRGEANAVLTALEEFLDLGDAEAWCKSCRRVWEGRRHRCESDTEQRLATLQEEHNQLSTRVEHLVRTLHAIRRFNQLTTDSCRVQAAEHARDNLDLLRDTLPVPVHLAAGSARAEFLNLCAQWGLTTGKGSRELVARILQHHAHENAEDLRALVRSGDVISALEGADRLDPYSPHYAGAQHR